MMRHITRQQQLAAWPALQQRIQEYHAAQGVLDRLSDSIRDMLDAWVTHQADRPLAVRWLHSQPFQSVGIVIPDELLPGEGS